MYDDIIRYRVWFQDSRDLAGRIVHVLKLGLEGLVLKDINVCIDPSKRMEIFPLWIFSHYIR